MWKDRVNSGGFRVASTYVLIVVIVFALCTLTARPENVGYDWIPFILLAMPWYRLNPQLLVPGLIANVGLMYLLGSLLHMIWRRVFR